MWMISRLSSARESIILFFRDVVFFNGSLITLNEWWRFEHGVSLLSFELRKPRHNAHWLRKVNDVIHLCLICLNCSCVCVCVCVCTCVFDAQVQCGHHELNKSWIGSSRVGCSQLPCVPSTSGSRTWWLLAPVVVIVQKQNKTEQNKNQKEKKKKKKNSNLFVYIWLDSMDHFM